MRDLPGWLPRAPDGEDAQELRLGLRRFRLFAGIFLVYLGYAFDGLQDASPVRLVLGVVLVLVFVALYLGPMPLGLFLDLREAKLPVLAAMSTVAVLYLLLVGPGGLVFTTYLVIAAVVALPTRLSAPVGLALCAATAFLPQYVDGWDLTGPQWAVAVPAVLVGVAMYATRLGNRQTRELHQARRDLQRLAKEQERLRIARDLHDLLGHALTTVTVKAELAARLVDRDPARAAQEMAEVAELARRGLADVRATVAGYREVSLVTELATAREVLRAAGIEAELPAAVEAVPADLRELWGWVVREGVTNVVRHSRASRVQVLLADRTIEVVDDGVGASGGPGNGLRGLTERAAGLGGRVVTGGSPTGFRLRVEVPA